MSKSAKANNKTGLSDKLKNGIENLSGISMNDLKVHYNSDEPDRLGALTYVQGTEIDLAVGQEKHLPHEAWHIVEQTKGRVKPTKQTLSNVIVNDDSKLENEAEKLGEKSLSK